MNAKMLIDAEDAPDAVYDYVWSCYISTPPTSLADALDGLDRFVNILDGCDAEFNPTARLIGTVSAIAARLRSGVPDISVACDLRTVAADAAALEPGSDFAIMLRSIANGMARPRLV